jgi:type I restriction enzyme S subunit
MEVKPGYKQSEVGVIPEEWEAKTFSQICRVNQGLQVAIEDRLKYPTATSRSYITIQFLNDRKSIEYINDYPPSACCSRDDVLMTRTGNTGIVVSGVEGVFHNNFFKINFDRRKLDRDFLVGFLSLSSTRKVILEKAGTSTIPDLNHGDFYSIYLPLPPLPEQRAIATALSDVDGLLGGLDRLIAKKRDLKQAAMQQLLTGQTRLPGFHGEWEVKAIHELSHVGRGRVISHTEISKAASPTYPVFSSQTSDSGIMGYLDTYDFDGDYVTWTTDGANAGTVFARAGRFNCTNVCGTIKLHDSDHRFIAAALGRVSQSHVSRHLGNPKLMNDVMKKIQITIPKTLPEQTAIASVLTEMDGELSVLEQRREKTRALKQAMMQELLTGRTRLV